ALLTTMLVSVAVTLAALWVLAARIAKDLVWGCLLVLLAMMSCAIYQYSTSGLENPLTFLLLALFVWRLSFTEKPWIPAALAGLLILNRMDLAVLVGPAVAYLLFQAHGRDRVKIAIAVSLPVLAWMVFSLIYYGAPFPNTAYAKLGTGYSTAMRAMQGLEYSKDFVYSDPLLAALMATALFTALRSRDRMSLLLGAGILLYVAYTVFAGGDYMSGRFFATPGFLALCLLAQSSLPQWPPKTAKIAGLIMIAIFAALLVARTQTQEREILSRNGIVDERRNNYPDTGLYPIMKKKWAGGSSSELYVRSPLRDTGKLAAKEAGVAGLPGYYSGPSAHIVEYFGITDAFLARLPAFPGSRVGHYKREMPMGYVASVLDASPRTDFKELQPLLNDVTIAARAPLLAEERWTAIWRLLSGHYNWVRDSYSFGATVYHQVSQGQYKNAEETANSSPHSAAKNIALKLAQAIRAIHTPETANQPQEALRRLQELESLLNQPINLENKWNPALEGMVYASLNLLVWEWDAFAKRLPESEMVRYHAGLYLMNVGREEYAVDHLRAAAESPRLPADLRGSAYKNLGAALMAFRPLAEAETPLRAALEQSPPDMQASCLLAEIYKRTSRMMEAMRASSDCLRNKSADSSQR
ncbi:MAG: glycosyltransferase family 39 protein, partial [Gallionellaceae bacterium]|nr:glycosyltransferase family 39 protein [Gallionellaceae bacterium]